VEMTSLICEFDGSAHFRDLLLSKSQIKPEQHRWSSYSRIDTLCPAIGKAQHSLIEKDVPRINLDNEVAAIVDATHVDIRDMEQRGKDGVGSDLSVYSELGEFAYLPLLSAYPINVLAIQLVNKQPQGGIEPHRDR